MSKPRSYHADWDTYVENWEFYSTLEPKNRSSADLVCPGDEWGTKKEWNRITNTYLKPYLPENSTGIAVEIGQGTGKYTLRVVDSVSKIVCFDVSKKFIEIAGSKLKDQIEQGTVFLEFLDLHNCYEIRDCMKKQDLIGKVDLFYSIDSMQHVEFHTLFAYFINAAICLKSGGHMVITVANCTSDDGFKRLLKEIPWCYGGNRPSHQFYFLSKDIIWYCLERLGFEVVGHEENRDILFVAKKTQKTEEKIRETQAVYAELVDAVAREDTQTEKKDLDLTTRLEAAEADRAARLEVIKDVCKKLEFFENECDRLLGDIKRLSTLTGFLKNYLRRSFDTAAKRLKIHKK